ncbi:hypothetical protein D3C72_1332720 [compost metagenome]
MFGFIFSRAVQKLVRELLEALETQVRTTDHQQWRDQPRHERTDRQRRWHQNQFVDERALGHGPDYGDFPFGTHAGDLLGVERQIIAEYAGGLLGGHFAHQRHVVQHGGNIVDQHQQTASCHESCFLLCMNVAKHNATLDHAGHS